MPKAIGSLVSAIVLASIACAMSAARAQDSACQRTLASTQKPAVPVHSSDDWYGSESLAVRLPPDGSWWGSGPKDGYRGHMYWWSLGYARGDESNLTVKGRRLDGDSAPARVLPTRIAWDPSFESRAMEVDISFPSAGCWEITGRYLGQTLSVVVDVPTEAPAWVVKVQAEGRQAEAADIAKRLEVWNARGIDSYSLQLYWAGPNGRRGPAEIEVRKGEIRVARYLARSNHEGAEVEADSVLRKTVPQLFATAIEAVKAGGSSSVGYDAAYEFPAEIFSRPPGKDPQVYKVLDFVVLE
ncbi:MAG TPA: DUF6174 domain-containing protein [Steroidobacteraceae bacterium]|nr:DUF6174 domain-containing protein [Steroidobacteraceae bacterium]